MQADYKEIAKGIAAVLSIAQIKNQILRFKLGVRLCGDWLLHPQNNLGLGCALCEKYNPSFIKGGCGKCPYAPFAERLLFFFRGCQILRDKYKTKENYCKARFKLYSDALKIKTKHSKMRSK